MMGQILVFRVARELVLRRMGWRSDRREGARRDQARRRRPGRTPSSTTRCCHERRPDSCSSGAAHPRSPALAPRRLLRPRRQRCPGAGLCRGHLCLCLGRSCRADRRPAGDGGRHGGGGRHPRPPRRFRRGRGGRRRRGAARQGGGGARQPPLRHAAGRDQRHRGAALRGPRQFRPRRGGVPAPAHPPREGRRLPGRGRQRQGAARRGGRRACRRSSTSSRSPSCPPGPR